ncbi:MAG: FAD-dependent monooxygenase, partial [Gammaproteobacteria bacterium]
LPRGPLAFLPLDENISSIVWSTHPDHAASLLALNEAAFCAELTAAFEARLGPVEMTGPRAVYPLRFFDAEHYVQNRLALIGDAAHTMHPLAGQGVNLGLADVASLAEVLLQAQQARRDLGLQHTLRRYERWRRSENRLMLASVDSFKRLYGSDMTAVRWLRNGGMNVFNQLGPLKQLVLGYAMGLSGDLPRLARGEPLLP